MAEVGPPQTLGRPQRLGVRRAVASSQDLSLKPAVSITKVSPSHRPTE